MSDSEEPIDLPDEGGDDLFGDDDGEEAGSERGNVLSDRDLASDQDGELEPRDEDTFEEEVHDKLVYEIDMYRHKTPKPKDGSVRGRATTAMKTAPSQG